MTTEYLKLWVDVVVTCFKSKFSTFRGADSSVDSRTGYLLITILDCHRCTKPLD
jgi:hypothetical protein